MFGSSLLRAFSVLFGALALSPAQAGGDGGAASPDLPVYTDPLPAEPEAITRAFFTDHTAWNTYANAEHARSGDFTGPEAAYRRLIDLYSGPSKHHLDLAFGDLGAYDPAHTRIIGSREEAGRTVIEVRHQYPAPHTYVAQFEFVFLRGGGGRWLLDEILYFDDYGRQWLPSL